MSSMPTPNRRLLPRWRLFYKVENFDELNQLGNKAPVSEDRVDHINAIEEWRDTNNLENAIELCASAIVHGKFIDAREPATFILDRQPRSQSVVAMAEKVLNPNQRIQRVELDSPQAHIANLRKKSHRSPANPILWVDMAFLYSSLGQNHKAERSIKNALILAPHNRFIVRCAARFFIHIDKVPEAQRAVENYRFLNQDPWVLAIKLSIFPEQKQKSKHLKLAKMTIESNRISEFHSSELASALGTVEISGGDHKKATKLFRHSLLNPTNNSIAQAQWIKNRHNLKFSLQDNVVNRDAAHEAQCYRFYKSGDWAESMRLAKQWAEYEPYSTQSFMYMSYVSLVCQNDLLNCIEYSKDGLKLRKNGFPFLNNLVVARAQLGQIEKAKELFSLIKKDDLDEIENSVYAATKGMLAFRQGKINEGRDLYKGAINRLNKDTNKKDRNLALLFFAREEIAAKTGGSYNFFREVQEKIKSEEDKSVLAFKENIEKLRKSL